MLKLAVDVGYGDTKVCVDGNNCFKFPSAVKYEEEMWTDYGDSKSDSVYEVDSVKYRVGTSAVEDAFSTTSESFLMKYSFLLIYHAVKNIEKVKNTKIDNVNISMGVSLANWKVKEQIVENIRRGLSKFGVTVSKISIYPQGRGVLQDMQKRDGNIVVVDVGFNTLDVLNFKNGQPNPTKSKAIPGFGMVKVISDFSRYLTREYGLHITLQETKDVFLKRAVVVNGEIIDLSEMIKREKKKYSDFIVGEIEAVFGEDYLKKANLVIFAGGGAYYIDNRDMPPNRVFCQPPYEYSNVRGYYMLSFGSIDSKGVKGEEKEGAD